MSRSEICFLPATELARCIKEHELSAREVMETHLDQIDRLNPLVNAVITLHPEQALAAADRADQHLASGEPVGPLHGLPVAHKDLVLTEGIRSTSGSLIYKDFIPEQDALIVERFRQAGAILIGKTNTPEFGAGSQTYNAVFGETLNPYDTTKTCGGSSGGAAVALACGMLPIADGSDMGGSLRNPASFCNVVGFRPSAGRVPSWPTLNAWSSLSVLGPMARTVCDVALILSGISGPDPRAPISIDEPAEFFARPLDRDFKETRIAWSPDLGLFPVDPRVLAAIEPQIGVFADLGCRIDNEHPDFSGADEIFKTLRAWLFALEMGDLLEPHRALMKDTVIWNIEAGLKLSGRQVAAAEVKRTALYHRLRRFMDTYAYLLLPVVQVPPFDIKTRFVEEINGQPMQTYIDWMQSCYFITATGHPAVSVPCGFTPEGLPVGLQIVGRYQDDFGVLQLAHAFEQATGFGRQKPNLA